MSNVTKYCPSCGFETADNDMNFCPKCSHKDGNGEVRLKYAKSSSAGNPSKVARFNCSKDRDTLASGEHIARVVSEAQRGVVGDANVIDGDVSVTNGDTNIYVESKELSDAERLRHNRAAYHSRCSELVKDGFVSQEAIKELNAFREELGLHKDIADYILYEVKEQSVCKRTVLSTSERITLDSIHSAIERNDLINLQESLKKLHALKKSSEIDEISQMYYQLKALLEPQQFVADFETIHEESYWELFWSYVALTGIKSEKSEESLAALGNWDAHYPANNQAILQTVGFLMNDKEQEARNAFRYIGHGYSAELEPLHFALRELLDKDWHEVDDVSPRARFYINALFKKTYVRFREISKQTKAEEIRIEQERIRLEQENKHKKEIFMLQYESKSGNLGEALFMSGLSQSQYDDWRRTDADFRMALDAINKRIDEKKKEAERVAHEKEIEERKEAERKAEEARQLVIKKKEFEACYRVNMADLLKTCTELDISRDDVCKWRNSDGAFNDALIHIEEIVAKEKRGEIIAKIKKVLPYVLVACLFFACIYGYHLRKEKEYKDAMELQEQRERAIEGFNTQFDEYISLVSNDAATDEDIQNLRKAANIVKQMRSEGLVTHIEDKIARIEDVMSFLLPMLDKAEDLAKGIGDEQEIKRIEYLKNIINDVKNDIGICND